MRIVWKDSEKAASKSYKYRGHNIERHQGGWIIDIPNDSNIYASTDSAWNSIDQQLGGKTRKDASARHAKGIKIIGTKNA